MGQLIFTRKEGNRLEDLLKAQGKPESNEGEAKKHAAPLDKRPSPEMRADWQGTKKEPGTQSDEQRKADEKALDDARRKFANMFPPSSGN